MVTSCTDASLCLDGTRQTCRRRVCDYQSRTWSVLPDVLGSNACCRVHHENWVVYLHTVIFSFAALFCRQLSRGMPVHHLLCEWCSSSGTI